MRQTVVPAQVTTVEDKIAGNISFKQMLLLVAPVFLGGAMYVFLPPFLGYSVYKIVLWILFALVCATLAVRIKGRPGGAGLQAGVGERLPPMVSRSRS